METKQGPDEFSQELQVVFLTTRWSRREFREAMYMSQTWSSADQRTMLGLTEFRGKPAVFIWNEKSKQCTLLIHSSLVILLFKLLLDGPGSLSSEESASKFGTLFGMDAQSWLQFIPPMFSVIPGSTTSFRRTSADSLVRSKASSAQSEYDRILSEQSPGSSGYGESSPVLQLVPTTLRPPSTPGNQTGESRAWASQLTGHIRLWFRWLTPTRRSDDDGGTS